MKVNEIFVSISVDFIIIFCPHVSRLKFIILYWQNKLKHSKPIAWLQSPNMVYSLHIVFQEAGLFVNIIISLQNGKIHEFSTYKVNYLELINEENLI